MALQDILNAIIAQADAHIDQERSQHKTRVTNIKQEAEQAIAKRKQEIAVQRDDKKQQLQAKAESHADSVRRNSALQTKQSLLDDFYNEVAAYLSKLSDSDATPILEACLARIAGEGTLYPCKKHADLLKKLAGSKCTIGDPIDGAGGFRFESAKEDLDFTFEALVHDYLRPQTEVDTAHKLFA